jgi:hypothetical protein
MRGACAPFVAVGGCARSVRPFLVLFFVFFGGGCLPHLHEFESL